MVPWTCLQRSEGLCRSLHGNFDACGLTIVHPCRVKSFRKAVSAVMDDLVKMLADKIIDNLHIVMIALKLASMCECL